MKRNMLRRDFKILPTPLAIPHTTPAHAADRAADSAGRVEKAAASIHGLVDMLSLAALVGAALALMSFLGAEDPQVQAACFQAFRMALMLSVAGFLAARSVQLMQMLRHQPVASESAAVAPRGQASDGALREHDCMERAA